MCGIAGIFRLNGAPAAEDAAAVLRMLDAQAHRGPDDWAILAPASLAGAAGGPLLARARGEGRLSTYPDAGGRPAAVLGARRLAIVDLSPRGRMPMGSPDGRHWAVHNGEIYNHRELRAELAAGGEPFRSSADTEVILRGHRAWGDAVLARLRGMFAFALLELDPRPRLFLARDRLGIKPLYYHLDAERIVFASEVRAIRRSGLVPDEPDDDALLRFLQLGSVPSPRTTVRNVSALPAGHCLVADAAGAALRPYGRLASRPAAAAPVEPARAAAATRALLDEAVRLHLVSDAPLGVFLSGGVDSSGLVALASGAAAAPLVTLSIAFDEPAYSEAPYARLVAERYATTHHEVTLGAGDFLQAVPRVLAALDEPTVDGVNTYFVSEAARRAGLTVVLSGTGGDELFFGYAHYRQSAALDRMRGMLGALPRSWRRGLLGVAAGRGRRDRLRYLERPTLDNVYLLARGLFGPRQIQALLGIGEAALEARGPALPPLHPGRARGALEAFAELEVTHYLQDQLLKDADVMGMAHSVEIRVPYLDDRVVEYVTGLPARLRLDGGRPKALLLAALGDALPRQVWDRPKMGFTFPFEPWMRRHARELEAAGPPPSRLDRSSVAAVWREFRAGRLHWSRPWALMVLAALEARRSSGAA